MGISIENYQKMTRVDFIMNYEVALMSYLAQERNLHLREFFYTGEEPQDKFNIFEIEKKFIRQVNDYINKRLVVLMRYSKHGLKIGKINPNDLTIPNDLLAHNDKREFLQYKLHKIDDSEKLERINEFQQIQEENILDYSQTTGTERIIYLEKLGVLEFLKSKEPFNTSTNSLATALSGMIGVNASTIQSYINPINNPSTSQSNNPLTKISKVKKVVSKLSNIGFNESN